MRACFTYRSVCHQNKKLITYCKQYYIFNLFTIVAIIIALKMYVKYTLLLKLGTCTNYVFLVIIINN